MGETSDFIVHTFKDDTAGMAKRKNSELNKTVHVIHDNDTVFIKSHLFDVVAAAVLSLPSFTSHFDCLRLRRVSTFCLFY